MNNNGCVSETLIVKIGDQRASVYQPMKSTDPFQDLTVFLPVFFSLVQSPVTGHILTYLLGFL